MPTVRLRQVAYWGMALFGTGSDTDLGSLRW